MVGSLPIVNLEEANYECIYGRGCDGICCRNGRPPVYPEEEARIDAALPRILPELRPEARALIEEEGYLSSRQKRGLPMMRVTGGWCVFFNQGCVLHKIGAEEGDKYSLKPAACALFPLSREEDGQWYVRQWGLNEEAWDLFCLNPRASTKKAEETLQEELDLAARFEEERHGAD